MSIYSGPVFEMASEQFRKVADHIALPENERDRLLFPKRAICVSIPIHRDDGRTEVFEGFRVQHHLTLGPTKGGTRFAPELDIGEVAALAVWMSWKCALTGLPYGGAKGGVKCSPRDLSDRELEAVSRRYMQEMIPFVGPQTDVMAPDLGTDERVMAWFMDTYSMYKGHTISEIVTGKPVVLGGTEGRREATGRGVAHLTFKVMERLQMEPTRCTAIVQGFGNVGSVAAASLAERGIKIIGVGDDMMTYYDPNGFDVPALIRHVRRSGSLAGYSHQSMIDRELLLVQKCDVLVPAAVERVITEANAAKLQCRILAEAANGPTTPAADEILSQRKDIFVIPDILCNAGGVIVSYFEWVQDLQRFFWDEAEVVRRLSQILDGAFERIVKRAERDGVSNRTAALAISVEKVWDGKRTRGLFP